MNLTTKNLNADLKLCLQTTPRRGRPPKVTGDDAAPPRGVKVAVTRKGQVCQGRSIHVSIPVSESDAFLCPRPERSAGGI